MPDQTDTPPLAQTVTMNLHVAAGDTAAFENWRTACAPLYVAEAEPPTARDAFFMDCIFHLFTDASLDSASSAAVRFDRSHATIAASPLDHVSVITYLEGGATLTANGRDTVLESGDVVLLDMTQTCTLVTTPYRHISLVMSRAALSEFHLDIEALHGAILSRDTPLAKLVVAHLQTLLAEAASLGPAEARAAVRGSIALVAAAVTPARRRQAVAGDTTVSLQTLRRMIEDNLGSEDLDADFLMQRMGLSRATLFRHFKPLGGVRSYIQQRRLARAFQAIAAIESPDERIGAIARRHGFSSDAVFSRAFRNLYGMSPTDMRAMIETGSGTPSPENQMQGFSRVNRWLKAIDKQDR